MSDPIPSRAEMEAAMRELRAGADLPDEILPHDGGGIVCLWHSQRLAPEPESFPPALSGFS